MQYPFDPNSLSVIQHSQEMGLFKDIHFEQSMGVPLCAEDEQVKDFYERLTFVLSHSTKAQLVVLFINEKENASLVQRESNQKVLQFFSFKENEALKTFQIHKHLILVVNGTLDPWKLKVKEGVGRARRILGDISLYLYKEKKLLSYLHRQSDADVRLPLDYFKAELIPGSIAGTYPFRHSRGTLSEEEYKGLLEYESFLRSYVEGLVYAGSPYAFWALGSTLIFDLQAYEKIRGFPNVQAGEDFYFLSKMQTMGLVRQIDTSFFNSSLDIQLEIVGRKSDRVPFGTGRALERLEKGNRYQVYPLEAFEKLKVVLVELKQLSEHRDVQKFFSHLSPEDHLNLMELRKSFEGIFKQKTSAQHCLRQLHQTFEGLQTFRWVREKKAAIYLEKSHEKSFENSRANSSA
ncbi:MAG: hypothetical protein WCK43_05585 [bacterium]